MKWKGPTGSSKQIRVMVSSRCYEHQPSRAFSVTASYSSPLSVALHTLLSSFPLRCQLEKDVDGSDQVAILLVQADVNAFHANPKVAIKPSFAISSFLDRSLFAP